MVPIKAFLTGLLGVSLYIMKKNVWYRGVIVVGLLAIAQTANADWQKTDTLNQYIINDFAVSGTNLFAATGGSGIFLSTDNGANWAPADSGLTDLFALCFAASGANLFAGTGTGGIFSSSNNGASWTPVDSGLPKKPVYSIAVIGTNIFAGTASGIYLTTNNGASWTPVDSGLPSKTTIVSCLAVSGTSNRVQKYGR
jgi:ligand-binding sensor domain-containing protein